MKKTVILTLVFCGVFLQNLRANEKNWLSCEKTYVSLDDVVIHQGGIFVRFRDEWYQTPALRHDSQGIFISSLAQADGWVCPKCGKNNLPIFGRCTNSDCQTRRP